MKTWWLRSCGEVKLVVQRRCDPGPINPDIQAATAVIGLNVDPAGYWPAKALSTWGDSELLGSITAFCPVYGGTQTSGLYVGKDAIA
jgi:hypothetical protein